MIPYPCLTGLSASYFAVRPHRNRWRTRSHQLGRRLRPTLRQSHTLPLRTPAPAASSFCSRQPTHTAPLSASTTGHRRYACSWPLAVLVNSLSNDSVSQRLGNIREASYSGMAWLVIGKSEDDAERRGLAWSDGELFVTRGGKIVSKVKLTPVSTSSDQTGPGLSRACRQE